MELVIKASALWLIYSFMGWVVETVYVSVNQQRIVWSGFLKGPYTPIYGFGAIGVIYLLDPFVKDTVLLFVLSLLLTSTIEYLTSWAMEKFFKVRLWDYSKHFGNINGRVCLLNSILFGLLSTVVVKWIHPFVLSQVERVNFTVLSIGVVIALGIVLADFVTTVQRTLDLSKRLELERQLREHIGEWLEDQRSELETRIERLRDRTQKFEKKLFKVFQNATSTEHRELVNELIDKYRKKLK